MQNDDSKFHAVSNFTTTTYVIHSLARPNFNTKVRAVGIGGHGGGRAPPIICTNMPPPPKKKKNKKKKKFKKIMCAPPICNVCPPPQSVIASYGPDLGLMIP